MQQIAVVVQGAPGFEDFPATLVMHEIPAVDARGALSVVQDDAGELFVIPSQFVNMGACQYAFAHSGTAVTVLDCGPAVGPVPACGACAALYGRLSR